MSDITRKLFNEKKQTENDTRIINVLVSLKSPADSECLQALENIGLKVTTANGNKLLGEINNNLLPLLKNHLEVLEVEPSVTLSPTKEKPVDP